jgi:dihydropteroate synthase
VDPLYRFVPSRWRAGDLVLSNEDHTLVMGILNVTPDSFSDGGLWTEPEDAITNGLEMKRLGADIVDIGGESTRPGAASVAAAEECNRVVPVVRALAEAGVVVSIDTSKAEVAAAALEAGAVIINDVTALADPAMAGVAADSGAGVVLMHMQGTPRTMQLEPRYEDVVAEVRDFLVDRAGAAEAAGIESSRICLDPGIGFGKLLEHNLELLAATRALTEPGYPVLLGASRKSFLTGILGDLPAVDRDVPTVAAHVLAIAGGAMAIRVHDVVGGLRTARVADAIVRAAGGEERP